MNQCNTRLQKITMAQLRQIYPKSETSNLHQMCVKSCQQMKQELAHLYDENTFPTSTLLGRIMSSYKVLAEQFIDIVVKNAELENEMSEMKIEMEEMKEYIYQEYEEEDEDATSTILQSQMAAPF